MEQNFVALIVDGAGYRGGLGQVGQNPIGQIGTDSHKGCRLPSAVSDIIDNDGHVGVPMALAHGEGFGKRIEPGDAGQSPPERFDEKRSPIHILPAEGDHTARIERISRRSAALQNDRQRIATSIQFMGWRVNHYTIYGK
jgi:hypothetical protein